MKPKYCQYCDLDVPFQDFPKHIKECESRTSECEKCHNSIMNKNLASHVITCTGKKNLIRVNPSVDRRDFTMFEMEDSLS